MKIITYILIIVMYYLFLYRVVFVVLYIVVLVHHSIPEDMNILHYDLLLDKWRLIHKHRDTDLDIFVQNMLCLVDNLGL